MNVLEPIVLEQLVIDLGMKNVLGSIQVKMETDLLIINPDWMFHHITVTGSRW